VANFLRDAGFESGAFGNGWTGFVNASWYEIQSEPLYRRAGVYSLRVGITHDLLGDVYGYAQGTTLTELIPGDNYTFQFWLKTDNTSTKFTLLVRHYPDGLGGGAAQLAAIDANTIPPGVWTLYSYTTSSNQTFDTVEFFPQADGGAYSDSVSFFVDDCAYGDELAIKLAERGVGSVVALLKSDLGTELGLIDTDRADTITMAVPAAGDYYTYPRAEIAGNASHVEVFEGELDLGPLDDEKNDLSSNRATYTLPLTIRVTWFNRTGDDMDSMVKRGQRYSAGVYNALIKSSDMGDADDMTLAGKVTAVAPAHAGVSEPEAGILKGQITMAAEVRCGETQ